MQQTTNQVVPFQLKDQGIRSVSIDGNPWFVASDACRVLGLGLSGGTHMHLAKLDATEKMKVPKNVLQGKGGNQATLISESGLYKLIWRSDKPEARRFQDWIAREVLPSIRKTGAY